MKYLESRQRVRSIGSELVEWIHDGVWEVVDLFLDKFERREENHINKTGASHGYAKA